MSISKAKDLLLQALAELEGVAPAPVVTPYRPTQDMTDGEIWDLWVRCGKPPKTSDGLDVDVRGYPLAWRKDEPWIGGSGGSI